MLLPREEILARTDLHALADELLGPRRRGGWACPAPNHGPQTGATPPVHIFTSTRGYQRWHCHACGTGGTAIDLLIITRGLRVRDALEDLASRVGLGHDSTAQPGGISGRQTVWRPTRTHALRPETITPHPALEQYVRDCEAHLWSKDGGDVREWLRQRRLSDEVLRANRVGADPGPSKLRRHAGLPRGGLGAVFPVLDADGTATYAQLRQLHPRVGGPKFLNPAAGVAPRPSVAKVRVPELTFGAASLTVCEGLPDALSAAQLGRRAVAILGTGVDAQRLGAELNARFSHNQLVIAFDNDEAGRRSADAVVRALRDLGHRDVVRFQVPTQYGDVNGWLRGNERECACRLEALGSNEVSGVDAVLPRLTEADLSPTLDCY